MKWIVSRFLLTITWPCVQALFTVETEKESYRAELNGKVQMVCRFSDVQSIAQLSVFWQRTEPSPTEEVYRLEKGLENNNFTTKRFWGRARLLKDELQNFLAVLELSQLRINDSGTYRCIVSHQEVDYKMTKLTIWAPYTSVKKSLRTIGKEEVELCCQSQGLPLASVVWSDSRLTEGDASLTQRSNTTSETTSDGTLNITSWVTVPTDDVSNYTCSFETEEGDRQEAKFLIPDEIFPEKCKRCHSLTAITVVAMIVAVVFTSLILLKRKKRQTRGRSTSLAECISSNPNLKVTSTDYLLQKPIRKPDSLPFFREGQMNGRSISLAECTSDPNLTATSTDSLSCRAEELRVVLRRHVTLSTASEVKSGFSFPPQVLTRENQCLEIQAVVPGAGEAVLLEGKKGTGKTSVAKWLACSWADSLRTDPLNIRTLLLVILVDFEGAQGDLFRVVASGLPAEAGLESDDIKEILLSTLDCLLILDGYKEGDREMDESLVQFLKGRRACRVLITACPEEHSSLGETVRKVLRLQTRPAQN